MDIIRNLSIVLAESLRFDWHLDDIIDQVNRVLGLCWESLVNLNIWNVLSHFTIHMFGPYWSMGPQFGLLNSQTPNVIEVGGLFELATLEGHRKLLNSQFCWMSWMVLLILLVFGQVLIFMFPLDNK